MRAGHAACRRQAEPAAVIVAMGLHFFDAATVHGISAAIIRAVARGSHVLIPAGSGDEQTGGRPARQYQADTLYFPIHSGPGRTRH